MTRTLSAAPCISFSMACLFEGGLGLLAVGLGWLVGQPVGTTLTWDARAALTGVAATIPMLGLFAFMSFSPWFRAFRRVVEPMLQRLFGAWSWPQLAVISLLAGVSEELFFRALVQGGLGNFIGVLPALVAVSLLFAVVHWINTTYAVAAMLMGLYLGALWLWSGNLLTPIVVHAVYDFVALMWVTRARRDTAGRESSER